MKIKAYVHPQTKKKETDKLLALGSLIFASEDGKFVFKVNDIRIMDGSNGIWVAYPSRKKSNGDFQDVAHPNNQDTRDFCNELLIGQYKKIIGNNDI